jgi:hypothetical protein
MTQQLTPRQRNKKKQIPYQHGLNNTPYSQGKFGYMILLMPPKISNPFEAISDGAT